MTASHFGKVSRLSKVEHSRGMTTSFPPPSLGTANDLNSTLKIQGFAVLAAPDFARAAGCSLAQLHGFQPHWNDLPPDTYLKDGGRYRRRRHSCFVIDGNDVAQVAHRPHWQPVEYNALHGGMQRWFEPLATELAAHPQWQKLLIGLARISSARTQAQPWFVEAHQFRIDTTDGIGRPTPEGAHRDGVDFVAVFMVDRVNIKGGETRVFEAAGPNGQRFTLTESWSLLLLDDARVIHESTPIQPVAEGQGGWRDTLVVTLRSGGFQGEQV